MSRVLPPVRIPKDPVLRRLLADMAGLTEQERQAIDQWCFLQEERYRARLARRKTDKT